MADVTGCGEKGQLQANEDRRKEAIAASAHQAK
jgi:hypothetical protein